jgi:hypothetical protein
MINKEYIHIHINRLVLEGLPLEARDGPAVRKAFESELARLITMHGLSQELVQGGAFQNVPAKDVVSSDRDPSQIGKEIARTVYWGIGDDG